MNGDVKTPVTLAIRKSLTRKVDHLANTLEKSRSEVVGRLLSTFIDDLNNPEVAWIKISKKHLMEMLKI